MGTGYSLLLDSFVSETPGTPCTDRSNNKILEHANQGSDQGGEQGGDQGGDQGSGGKGDGIGKYIPPVPTGNNNEMNGDAKRQPSLSLDHLEGLDEVSFGYGVAGTGTGLTRTAQLSALHCKG